MRGIRDLPNGTGCGPDRQVIPGDGVRHRKKLKQFLGQPDRLPSRFLFEFRASPEFFKKPLIGLAQLHGPIAQNL